jgi:prepilin-type N-terminal cleavage/methylation domain-containing protein
MRNRLKNSDSGFSIVELLIVLVVIAAIVAAGIYVAHRDNKNKLASGSVVTSSSTSSAATSQPSSTTITPTNVSATIDQITQQTEQAEANTYSAADAQIQQIAVSPNAAVANMGGAYNAAGF